MTVEPASGRKEFQGFDAFYEREIAPYLKGNEDARQRAVLHAALIAIAAAVAAFAGFKFGPFGDRNVQLAFFTAIAGFAGAGWRLDRTRNDITRGLLQQICRRLGFGYRLDMVRPDCCTEFDRLGLLPNYNRQCWEDEVTGERHSAAFNICEAHLKYKSSGKNNSTRTVFHGQLLVIDYHKEFLGETVVKRDAGIFNRMMKPDKNFQRVGLVSPKFEKIFEAWSTDQVEARELLDPLVLERFEELDRLFGGAKLRAAFSVGRVYVALETGDKLNMGTMFKPLDGPERVAKILQEFDLIFDLIDVLVKQATGRLDGAFTVDAIKSV